MMFMINTRTCVILFIKYFFYVMNIDEEDHPIFVKMITRCFVS